MTGFAGYDLPDKIVMLSTADWDAPLWTNKQQVASRLAGDFKIIYVEPLAAVGSGNRKLLAGGARETAEGITVYRPPAALPFGNKLPPVNLSNVARVAGGLNALLRDRGFTEPLLWCYPPASAPFLSRLPHALSCYDCVDDYSAFPGAWGTIIRRMERQLIRGVDAVFTTAQSLYEEKRRFNPRTHFVPNVADFDHFHQATTAAPPPRLREMPRPVIGFIGALNYKIDSDFLEVLFRLRPQWSFVFVGPDRGMGVERFAGVPNAHFLGRKEIAELPALMAGFDACMIPYKINRYIAGVLPLKFFEYLATGKPIIATRMPELLKFAPLIDLAANPDEFVQALEKRLADDRHREPRLALARENSWEHRIGAMLSILEKIHKDKREELL